MYGVTECYCLASLSVPFTHRWELGGYTQTYWCMVHSLLVHWTGRTVEGHEVSLSGRKVHVVRCPCPYVERCIRLKEERRRLLLLFEMLCINHFTPRLFFLLLLLLWMLLSLLLLFLSFTSLFLRWWPFWSLLWYLPVLPYSFTSTSRVILWYGAPFVVDHGHTVFSKLYTFPLLSWRNRYTLTNKNKDISTREWRKYPIDKVKV